ncbi:MAG TPA: putative 2OG-Fe(II) oxygenase, partial [Rhizomicrobium sp.]|nr:putative 2OG-Fe(II) oxygenase [Rhizomicrobium sp.]
FGESPFGLGKDDRPSRVVTPAVGKLVLFPSYFWHGTARFMANHPRLTVAFDVVPRSSSLSAPAALRRGSGTMPPS